MLWNLHSVYFLYFGNTIPLVLGKLSAITQLFSQYAIPDICSPRTAESLCTFFFFLNTVTLTHFKASNTPHTASGKVAALRCTSSSSFLYQLHRTRRINHAIYLELLGTVILATFMSSLWNKPGLAAAFQQGFIWKEGVSHCDESWVIKAQTADFY